MLVFKGPSCKGKTSISYFYETFPPEKGMKFCHSSGLPSGASLNKECKSLINPDPHDQQTGGNEHTGNNRGMIFTDYISTKSFITSQYLKQWEIFQKIWEGQVMILSVRQGGSNIKGREQYFKISEYQTGGNISTGKISEKVRQVGAISQDDGTVDTIAASGVLPTTSTGSNYLSSAL